MEWSSVRLEEKMEDETDWTLEDVSSLFESKFLEESLKKTTPPTRDQINRMMDKYFEGQRKWRIFRGTTMYFVPVGYISLGLPKEDNILVQEEAPFVLSHKWVEDCLVRECLIPEVEFGQK